MSRWIPDEMLGDGKRRWVRLPGLGFMDRVTELTLEWVGLPHSRWVLTMDDRSLSRDLSAWKNSSSPPFASAMDLAHIIIGVYDWPLLVPSTGTATETE